MVDAQAEIEVTEEDKRQLITLLMGQTSDKIREFLREKELAVSGAKAVLRERIEGAIGNGGLTYAEIINWIDTVEPWNKQHVFLYDGPQDRGMVANWRNRGWIETHLSEHGVNNAFGRKEYLFLPAELQVSSVELNRDVLRILAVEKRVFYVRRADLDRQNEADETVIYHAFRRVIQRGIIVFEWNLMSNKAILQIAQLHRGTNYEEKRDAFFLLVEEWLNIKDNFSVVDISKAIRRLNEEERSGATWIMSQRIAYDTESNKHIELRSATAQASVLGDTTIDETFDYVRAHGLGKLGNFYWLPSAGEPTNPVQVRTRTELNAFNKRINFPTDSTEACIRYVLQRVREFSQ